jgi:ComF family protein
LANPLSSLLWASYLNTDFATSFDWVVPVPTHGRRQRQRGFDHTLLLARAFSLRSGIPIFDGLSRPRYTQPQFGLDKNERRRNLRGAFSLSKPPLLKNRNLIIIDDVLTTGTTVSELTRLIREKSSASRILVLVVARALLASEG